MILTQEQYQAILDTDEWKEWRDKHISERCRWCGANKGLNLHHYRYNYNDDPKEALYDDENVITLCSQCHETLSRIKDIIQNKNSLIKIKIQQYASNQYNKVIIDEIEKLAKMKSGQSVGFITFNDKSLECLSTLDYDIKKTIDGQIIGKLPFIDTGSLSWVSHYYFDKNGGIQ